MNRDEKEHPILFSAEMAGAILAGRKTQTRRVIKPQPQFDRGWWIHRGFSANGEQAFRDGMPYFGRCPYGVPGDRLRFLSTWATELRFDNVKPLDLPREARIWSLFDGSEKPEWCGKNRPGRFMPKWIRTRMPCGENTRVRVEKLHEICGDRRAINAEGISADDATPTCVHTAATYGMDVLTHRFACLWASINGPDSWNANPWIWVVDFSRKSVEQ